MAPLRSGHGACSRIGEQIDEDILGRNLEQVEAGLFEELFALLTRDVRSGSDALDAEWLYDSLSLVLSLCGS